MISNNNEFNKNIRMSQSVIRMRSPVGDQTSKYVL